MERREIKLDRDFYMQENVVSIAKSLIGKKLLTLISGVPKSGIITETEAYAGINDRASHAFGGKRTERTDIMYHCGGVAYIYLCYGIHSLFNVVTNREDIPDAVLIRGIAIFGNNNSVEFVDGPGRLSKNLGISLIQNGISLCNNTIWIENTGIDLTPYIYAGERVGIDYAGEDAKRPYRFRVYKDSTEIREHIQKGLTAH